MKPPTMLFALLASALLLSASAQQSTAPQATDSTTATAKKTVLTASANYVSRLNYFGRVDSLHSSGFFPIISLDSKVGLYVNSSFIFTDNAVQAFQYAGTSIEGGYKLPDSKHFGGNIFYTQFLYTNTTAIVQSALKSQTGVNLTWKNKYVNVTGGGELRFSNNTDIGVTGTLDHLFIFKIPTMKKTAVALNPTATVNAGTQKFAETLADKNGGVLGGLTGLGGESSTYTENISRFNVLSYEFSMPIVFVVHEYYLALTPAYVIPQNLITVPGNPSASEHGENLFYFTATAGVRWQFR